MQKSNSKANQNNNLNKNPLETLKDLGASTVKNTFDSVSSIGGGKLDPFF